MRMVTTHTEGRVVTHSGDDAGPIEVVQLPARDAAVQAATAPAAGTLTADEKIGRRPIAPGTDPPAAAAPGAGKKMHAGKAPKAPKAAKKRPR